MVDELMYGNDEMQLRFLETAFPRGVATRSLHPLLIRSEHLLGQEFKGKFWRDPRKIEEDRAYWIEHQGKPAEYERTHKLANAVHEFTMWPFFYNPETGLFIARGRDAFGDSGIVGLTRNSEIKFVKAYVREEGRSQSLLSGLEVIDDYACFRLIEYSGALGNPESGLVPVRGKYQMHDYNHLYHGFWTLDSCEPARFPMPE